MSVDLDAVIVAQRGPAADLVAVEQHVALLYPDHGRLRFALRQLHGEAHRGGDLFQRHVCQERVAHRGGGEGQLQVFLLVDHLQVKDLDLALASRAFFADDAFHGIENEGGAVGFVHGQQVLAHGVQLGGIGEEFLDRLDQRVGGQVDLVPVPAAADLLVEDAGAADFFDLAGVEDLVVSRQVDLGDQDGRQPLGGDLLDGPGAGPGYHQVGDLVYLGDSVEVLPQQQPAFDLGRVPSALQVAYGVVIGLVTGVIGLAGGHDDEQVGDGEEPRQGLNDGAVDGACPHAAAADEQDAAVRGDLQLVAALQAVATGFGAFSAGGGASPRRARISLRSG